MTTHPTPNKDQLRYWLALWRTPGIGPKHFAELLSIFPDLSELFQQPSKYLQDIKLSTRILDALRHPDWVNIERDWHWGQQSGNTILTYHDPAYPSLLRQIPAAPPLLFVKGDCSLLASPQIAIVGSRNPTPFGLENARYFAEQLVQVGFTITSGLALGIDAASHNAALAAQGHTIAVMTTGMDHIYPARHKSLANEIIFRGAIVSELPIGTPPLRENFPRRNRIISGLSLGVLVIEAAERSGSLITAQYANEQGREVFALPGSINNPFVAGCHKIIQQGAKLVTQTADIIEELKLRLNYLTVHPKKATLSQQALDKAHQNLVNCIGYEATSIEIVALRSGLAINIVTALLSELEIAGYVKTVPGGVVRTL